MVQVLAVSPGDVLAGKYRVEKVLGIGGMGAVVSARHVELGTKVALKFLLPQLLESQAAVARFQREARAAVRLKGQHTAKITDVGKLENGAPYLVMEYLTGRDLGQVVAGDGPLPVLDAVSFTMQACESLAEAHGLGIVHRDLKPQNLFLTRAVDGTPLVKVLDFGLARMDGDASEQRLTQTTDVMGSPAYMSPEQLRGAREAGAKSDIWSMGVCLFELLTGRLPFESRTVPELCAMVLMQPPMPVRALRSEVPVGVENAILRCLEKDAAARFQNVVELAAALEPFGGPAVQGATRRIASTYEGAASGVLAEDPPAPIPLSPQPLDTSKASVFASSETAIDMRGIDTRTAFDSGTRHDGPRYGKAVWIGVSVALSLAAVVMWGFWYSGPRSHDDGSSTTLVSTPASADPASSAAASAPPSATPPLAQGAGEPASATEGATSGADSGATAAKPAPHAAAPYAPPTAPVPYAPPVTTARPPPVVHTAPAVHATPRPAATAAGNGRDHI